MSNKENFTELELVKIKSRIEDIDSFMSDCIEWSETSPNVNNPKQISKQLKGYRRRIRKVAKVVDQKPAIAFFGASQSGKSHLVKNLLQHEKEKKFYIFDRNTGQTIDYLKSINPEGNGNESTALVTRFVQKDSIKNSSQKPIKVELLTVRDLILCICDGFYSIGKLDKVEFDYTEKILECVSQFTKSIDKSSEEDILNEDDIYFIKNYLEKYKKSVASRLLHELEINKFWDHLANSIGKISWEQYAQIFDIFWFQQEQFNELFQTLLSCLSEISFSNFIYCDFDLITRNLPDHYKDKFRDITNILDVRSLENILNDKKLFSFEIDHGKTGRLSNDIICALCKEVILEIPFNEKPESDFLSHLDILDFPGSRPGTPISIVDKVSNKDLGQAILRGKVNFLFNTYSDNYQLNNLAIVSCLAEQKDGAGQIPEILNNWIDNYIGSTPKERQLSVDSLGLPPLFVILTFWNKILHYDHLRDNLDPKERFDTAFITRFNQDILSNNSWYRDWLPSRKKFQNFYLLRDFNYCKLFNRDNQNNEGSLDPQQAEYYVNAKEYFLNMKEVNGYFEEPQLNWQNATSPNQDGSDLIIENLFEVTSNKPKTQRLVNITNETFESFLLDMPKAYKGDVSSMVLEAKRKAQDISARLGILVEEGASLGELQEVFMVSEQEIYEILLVVVKSHRILSAGQLKKHYIFLLQHPELKNAVDEDQKLEILMKKFGYDSKEKMRTYLEEDLKFNLETLFDKDIEKMKKRSTYIADVMKDYWIEQRLSAEHNNTGSEFIANDSIKRIGTALSNNYARLQMTDRIAKSICDYVDDVELSDEAYFMVSNIIAGIMNNFVMTAGWKYTAENEKIKIRKIATDNNVDSHELTTKTIFNKQEIDHGDIQEVFNYIENEVTLINDSLDHNNSGIISKSSKLFGLSQWQDFLKLSFMANVDSVDYDIDSNDKLLRILEKNKELLIKI